MKTKLPIAVLLLTLAFCSQSQAQTIPTDAALMHKYWNYRDVFRKYFIKIGNDAGYSLPASEIRPYVKNGSGGFNHATLYTDTVKITSRKTEQSLTRQQAGHLPEYWFEKKWGDVIAWESSYMGTLASESFLLKANGQEATDLTWGDVNGQYLV